MHSTGTSTAPLSSSPVDTCDFAISLGLHAADRSCWQKRKSTEERGAVAGGGGAQGRQVALLPIRESRLAGVLDVLGEPSTDDAPIFIPEDEPFTVRLRVNR